MKAYPFDGISWGCKKRNVEDLNSCEEIYLQGYIIKWWKGGTEQYITAYIECVEHPACNGIRISIVFIFIHRNIEKINEKLIKIHSLWEEQLINTQFL